MSAWRQVHIGIEGDGLKIDGVKIWQHEWRRTNEGAITLPHPQYKHQLNQFVIYETGLQNRSVRFAACELSNAVWGFNVPTPASNEDA